MSCRPTAAKYTIQLRAWALNLGISKGCYLHRTCVYTHIHTHTRSKTYVYIYVHTFKYMAYLHVCVYIYTCVAEGCYVRNTSKLKLKSILHRYLDHRWTLNECKHCASSDLTEAVAQHRCGRRDVGPFNGGLHGHGSASNKVSVWWFTRFRV